MIETTLILSALLQFADAWTTAWILQHGGEEKNPVLRWLIKQAGLGGALALKVALVLGLLAWCWLTDFFSPAPWAAYFIMALSAAVVLHNSTIIRRIREQAKVN